MAHGLRQRDPNTGAILIDITSRLPKIMGRVNIAAGASGFIDVPVMGNNPVVYWFNADTSQPDFNTSPIITDDGANRISWNFVSPNPLYQRSGVLVYGRY